MKVNVKPSIYSYRGQFQCKGLLFDAELTSETTIIKRVIQLWETGASLFQSDSYFILLWKHERSIVTQEALGFPIVLSQSVLATVPLRDDFFENQEVLKTGLWHLKHGEYINLEIIDANVKDPSHWLDIRSFQLTTVDPLGVLPTPPAVVNQVSENSSSQVFKRVNLSASDEQKEMLSELQRSKNNQSTSLIPSLTGSKSSGRAGEAGGQPSKFSRLLASLFQGGGSSGHGTSQAERDKWIESDGEDRGSIGSSGLSLRMMLTRLALMTGYDRLLGGKQASYLRKMAKMFEQGDLEEALKHAVPMSDIRDAEQSGHPALRGFSRRAALNMQLKRQQGGSVSAIDLGSVGYLTQLYEQAFQRLDREGKVKEAAFVLSELLRAYQRAVDYLEKHEQYELAAELAEGQQLNPERMIKQWVLAGNHQRAIYIAKMTGCYKPAIDILTRKNKKLATELACEFAHINANAGYYKEAIELAWLGDIDNSQITNWLLKVIDGGDPESAILLVRYLCVCKEDQQSVAYEPLRKMLADRTFDGLSLRQSIYSALVKYSGPSALVPLARLALRSYADDANAGLISVVKKQMSGLQAMVMDPVLGHDFNALGLSNTKQVISFLKDEPSPRRFKLLATGGAGIVDICLLNANILLVAKGDAGLDVLRPNGRLLTRLAISCHRIVRSDSGQHALLLANHNQYTTVSKFDVSTLKATRWSELKLTCWTTSFDGFYWLVANQNSIWALDIQGDGQQAVWSVNDLPGSIQALNRGKNGFSLACNNDALDYVEMWRYELPSMLLRERESLDKYALIDEQPLDLGVDATVLTLRGSTWNLCKGSSKGNCGYVEEGNEVLQGKILTSWVALVVKKSDGQHELALYDRNYLTHRKCRLVCEFPVDSSIHLDLQDNELVVGTDAGDVACFDLHSGTMLANFTV